MYFHKQELAILMPDTQFDIRFIGPGISQAIDGRSFTSRNSRMSGRFHRGLYHEVCTTLQKPDCIIGKRYSWMFSVIMLKG